MCNNRMLHITTITPSKLSVKPDFTLQLTYITAADGFILTAQPAYNKLELTNENKRQWQTTVVHIQPVLAATKLTPVKHCHTARYRQLNRRTITKNFLPDSNQLADQLQTDLAETEQTVLTYKQLRCCCWFHIFQTNIRSRLVIVYEQHLGASESEFGKRRDWLVVVFPGRQKRQHSTWKVRYYLEVVGRCLVYVHIVVQSLRNIHGQHQTM